MMKIADKYFNHQFRTLKMGKLCCFPLRKAEVERCNPSVSIQQQDENFRNYYFLLLHSFN